MDKELFTREDLQQLTKVTVQIDSIMEQLKKLTKIIETLIDNQKRQEIALDELKTQVALLQISTGDHKESAKAPAKSFFVKNWYYLLATFGGAGAVIGWFIDHAYYLYHLNPKK